VEATLAITILFAASFATSFAATRIVKVAAERIGLVDRPDERKKHEREIPRVGGLAIIFGFGFPLLLLAANSHAAGLVSKNLSFLFAMLASGSLIVGLGVYDDLVGADAPKKFVVQTAAAIILVSFGYQFTFVSFAGQVIHLGFVGAVVSVVWIVGVINALNFIDGMDSLATVVSITIAVAFAVIAVARQDAFSLVVMTALAGSLTGFYWWNKPPARIFMGDSGSMFIGLLLAAGSIAKPSKSPTAIIITGPMLALALPVLDTLIVMKQRFGGPATPLSKRISRLFNADRRHIHHVLVARFGSDGKAILSIWSVTVLFAAAAVMTAIDATKKIGYTAGIVGFLLMLALRYPRRRHGAETARLES
jgi:UDP-GlcNAc:undecaprenyl-phosphate/decaprenyl-phosphate GlcNAc-1-phosphate transferase